jgi:hypothetical protein
MLADSICMLAMDQDPSIIDLISTVFVGVMVVFVLTVIFLAMLVFISLILPLGLGSLVGPWLADSLMGVLSRALDSRIATICIWVFGCAFLTWVLATIWILVS